MVSPVREASRPLRPRRGVGGMSVLDQGSATRPVNSDLPEETFLSLEALARRGAYDSMGKKGAPRDGLSEDQFDSLSCHLLGIGIRAFRAYDRELSISEGDAFNHAYRSMRGYSGGHFTEGPYIDWLRTNIRDSRFEPDAI